MALVPATGLTRIPLVAPSFLLEGISVCVTHRSNSHTWVSADAGPSLIPSALRAGHLPGITAALGGKGYRHPHFTAPGSARMPLIPGPAPRLVRSGVRIRTRVRRIAEPELSRVRGGRGGGRRRSQFPAPSLCFFCANVCCFLGGQCPEIQMLVPP